MENTKAPVKTARWDISSGCNLNCLHCCAEGLYDYSNSKYLDADSAIKLLNKLWQDGIVHLNLLGKEPFLYPHIYTVLKHACDRGFRVDITTNGTMIKDSDIDLLVDLGLQCIYFSIDGASAQVNDAIRGEGVFSKTVSTMQKVLEEKQRKNSSLMVNINTVLTRINASDINNIVDLCLSYGISLFKLSHLLDLGNASSNFDSLYLSPEEEFEAIESVIARVPYHPELLFDILSDKPLLLEYFYERYNTELPVRLSGCKACIQEIYIDPSGGMSPCLATSEGFSKFSPPYYKQYKTNILELKDRPIYTIPFYEDFKSAFPLTMNTYKDYVPCNRCPYLATICYPCPLYSTGGVYEEKLCLIAEKKLYEITSGAN